MRIRYTLLGALLWLTVAASAQGQARFSYSPDGSEVTDRLTSLTWRRCAEGMTWSGATCTGTAGLFGHNQALAHAVSQNGWRLPNVKELASIVDDTRYNPAVDPVAFPNTPSESFWTSTPQVGFPQLAWLVRFYDGLISDYISTQDRNNLIANEPVYVRLVRTSP